MKKKFMAVVASAFIGCAAMVAEGSIEQIWTFGTTELNADWSGDAPMWSSPTDIKSKSCARFATAADGKVYTVNMRTMSIAEITGSGWKDVYKLPVPDVADDYYGTSLSVDQKGNFLVGHCFTKVPQSSIRWSIYKPSTGETETFELPVPDDYKAVVGNDTFSGVGRIDCVGRVLGDLSGDAVFFIAPAFGTTAPFVRIVRISHDKDGKLTVDAGHSPAVPHDISSSSVVIAQPKDKDMADFAARSEVASAFYMYVNGGPGNTEFYTFDNDGAFDYGLHDNVMLNTITRAYTSGFDTFVLNGKRYFVINYLTVPDMQNSNTMDIAVITEEGTIEATWHSEDYASAYGYSSIVAEPLENGTANIYVYNSTTADGNYSPTARSAAAKLNFNPEGGTGTGPGDEPGRPGDQPGSSEDNPIIVADAQDLMDLKSKLVAGDNYIAIDADIDMAGIAWTVLCAENSRSRIHIDGRCHIISNLRPVSSSGQNGSLIGYLSGSVKNLGLEDVVITNNWYCVGGIAGVASDATIDNCFVSGLITGAAAGALVGCNRGSLVISNCYSFADIADQTGAAEYAGGLVGRSDAPLEINNSYASCTVTSVGGHAGGIVSVQRSQSVILNNVIAWNMAVDGKTDADALCAGAEADVYNVYVWDGMSVNLAAVSNGRSADELRDEVARWDAFNYGNINAITSYPALNWETKFITASVEAPAVDNDAAPVYYNLQGVPVANPESGIYIMRRGTEFRKVYIR